MQDVVISLGGSLIVPTEIDTDYIRQFRGFIMQHLNEHRFFIVCGGGSTARKYIRAAAAVTGVKDEDKDWLGIHTTRLNAHLLRTIFAKVAHPAIIKDPTEKRDIKERVVIGAGWKPGSSTDYVTVRLAHTYSIQYVINVSDVDYLYDSNPKENPDARPIEALDWKQFCSMVGDEWIPGTNAPFDPIASKYANETNMTVIIADGRNIPNLEKIIAGQTYVGTTIKN